MKYLTVIAMTAMLAATSARAENWQTVNTTHDGKIIEIDLDSVKHNKDGSASASVNEVRLYFDCNGHASTAPNGAGATHIAHGSIGETLAALACDK